jgi:glutamate/tyrosine decarboxylase-like PLP-dependent enzyme
MGQDGYMRIAKDVMETTLEIVKAVQRIDGLKLMAVPDMTCVSFTTEGSLNIHAVADAMEKRGWKMERYDFWYISCV